ncbi:MAG: DUF488 domain-containing protein [Anaerolineae bacterium]|nr:DUF488 domain-containing protein [Anaerolineae bacterium]
MPDTIPIYTIGYGSRAIDDLIAVLHQHDIAYLIDVRSAPYSRYKPEFSKNELDTTLRAVGIRYLFLGRSLGGRPDDPDCYSDSLKLTTTRSNMHTFFSRASANSNRF